MLDVFVMEPAEADAVRGIERSTALPDAHDVVYVDLSSAWLADASSRQRS